MVEQATSLEIKQLCNISTARPKPCFIKGKWHKPTWSVCYFYNKRYLPSGLFRRVIDLKADGWDVHIDGWERLVDTTITKEAVNDRISALDIPFEARYYQKHAIYLNRRFRKTTQTVGTGGGKTFIFYCSARDALDSDPNGYNNKFLAIVPSQLLVEQMASDVRAYQKTERVKVYKIHSSANNYYDIDECNIVCITFQSLPSMPLGFFAPFTGLFVDEDHRSRVYAIQEGIKKLKHVKWKWGMSGSVPDKDGLDMLNIESYIGANLYDHPVWKMIEDGDVSGVEIKLLEIHHGIAATRPFFDRLRSYGCALDANRLRALEEEYLICNKPRNDRLADMVSKLDGNTVVLSKRVGQVTANYESLLPRCAKNGSRAYKVHGTVKLAERRDILEMASASTKGSVIAANVDCLGTGVSLDTLVYGVFDGVGKSPYMAIQAIGRMLRKHKDKKKAYIIDVCDILHTDNANGINTGYAANGYSARHQRERVKIYKENKIAVADVASKIYI